MRRLLAFSILISVFGSGPAFGEVSVSDSLSSTLILAGHVEDPDPLGVWTAFRPVAAGQLLNSGGDARGDGRPDIVWRDNGWPVAVWAFNATSDHDIAYSEWDGTAWGSIEFLTDSIADEVDPRVVVGADGVVHVVWSVASTERVVMRTRPAGSTLWDSPIYVTDVGGQGGAPSLAIGDPDGVLRVSFVRDSTEPGMAQDVMVATLDGASTVELVGSTARTGQLYAIIHSESGKNWVEWIHGAQSIACAESQQPGWSSPVIEPWISPGWIGVEEARKRIRLFVLAD